MMGFSGQVTNFEQFIEASAAPLQGLLTAIDLQILRASPHIYRKFVYNVPFYYQYRRVLYLNPGRDAVDIGFCMGHQLSNVHGALEVRGRKIVRSLLVTSLEGRMEKVLEETIHEALLLDDFHFRGKGIGTTRKISRRRP